MNPTSHTASDGLKDNSVLKDKRQIRPLNSVRFIMAMTIFFHHIEWFKEGYYVVTAFFMLSGFVLYLNYHDREFSAVTFWIRRIARIWPLHLLTLAAAFFLYGYVNELHEPDFSTTLMLQLSLLQSWTDQYFSYNGVAWFLSDLFFLYLLFPLLLKAIDRSAKYFQAGVAVYFTAYVLYGHYLFADEKLLFYISPLLRATDFAAGMLLGCFYISRKIRIDSPAVIGVLESTFFLFIASPFLKPPIYDPNLTAYCYYLAVSMLFILFFVIASQNGGSFLHRLLEKDFFVYLGDISFSFFMTHQLVIRALVKYWRIKVVGPAAAAGMLACVIAVSALFHHFLELPATRLIERKIHIRRRFPVTR